MTFEPQMLITHDPRGDDVPLHFARAWAESTVRMLRTSRAKRAALRDRERENAESDFDQVSDPFLQRAVREAWTTECLLILSAAQLETWVAKLHRARRRKVPKPVPTLAALRNAIEHLEESDFDEGDFVARPGNPIARKRGIGALPGGKLRLYVSDDEKLLGVITPEELDALARGLLDELVREDKEWLRDVMDSLRLVAPPEPS